MATRSMIAIEKGVDVYDSCYCHFDGYPVHNGKILKERFNTEQLVFKLIEGGDMSCLKEKLEDVEYYTKRGEKLHVYENLSYDKLRKAAKDVGCEYIYIFFPDENFWGYTEVEDNFCSTISL